MSRIRIDRIGITLRGDEARAAMDHGAAELAERVAARTLRALAAASGADGAASPGGTAGVGGARLGGHEHGAGGAGRGDGASDADGAMPRSRSMDGVHVPTLRVPPGLPAAELRRRVADHVANHVAASVAGAARSAPEAR